MQAATLKAGVTLDEARSIAKEAFIYAFPMVDSYRIQHHYFVDRESPEFKAPWNQLRNIARVYMPDDKAIQTPNPHSLTQFGTRSSSRSFTRRFNLAAMAQPPDAHCCGQGEYHGSIFRERKTQQRDRRSGALLLYRDGP
jgi:hypothetical protein